MLSSRLPWLALAFVTGCRVAGTPAPTVAQTSAYVVRLGNDTLAVDRFTRVGDRIEGTLVSRFPRTVVTRYLVTMNPDGTPSLVESSSRLADGSLIPPARTRSTTQTYSGDGVVTQLMRDTVVTLRSEAPNAFPYINYSMAFIQLAVQSLGRRGDSVASAILPVGGRNTTPMAVVRTGAGRFDYLVGPYRYHVRTDDRGVIQSVDGTGTTQQFLAERRPDIDVSTIASAWGSDPAPRGALSARDTVTGQIGAATLWVDYSRPATRGRVVFGPTGVLNDTLWRTGANAATQFRTDVAIEIGGQPVPPGTYTLWTLAIPGRYQLIINRQTGQWGTEYDPSRDLTRVPLTVSSLPESVERFTIVVDSTAEGAGVLRLRWATTELSAPIRVP